MKLLLDQNLSYKLIHDLQQKFPDSNHIRLLGLEFADDAKVWEYARINSFTIVTQDSDFYERSLIYGHPPKIIWITTGNVATQWIRDLLLENTEIVEEFAQNPELACLELY